jgi:hypothetical protein
MNTPHTNRRNREKKSITLTAPSRQSAAPIAQPGYGGLGRAARPGAWISVTADENGDEGGIPGFPRLSVAWRRMRALCLVPLRSPLRLMRAALFAAVCLALSATGHWWMSGQAIPLQALVIGYAVVFGVALALTGRERSYAGIAAVVLLSEPALHFYFAAAQAAAKPPAAAMPMGSMATGSMSRPGMDMGAGMSTGTGMSMGAGHGMGGMLTVHVLAGLISAWWLRRGEAAVFTLVRAVAMTAFQPLRSALLLLGFSTWTPPAPARPAHDAWQVPDTSRSALLHAVVRRGPPLTPHLG